MRGGRRGRPRPPEGSTIGATRGKRAGVTRRKLGFPHPMKRIDFFFYGTLRDPTVRHLVLGPVIPKPVTTSATLPGYRVAAMENGLYPIAVADKASVAEGLLVSGVDLTAASRASFFEDDGYDYGIDRRTVVASGGRAAQAWVYLPSSRLRPDPGHWQFAEWERRYRSRFLAGAHRAMRACRAADIERHRQAWHKRLGGGID
ncbi:MAG: gamma-glutamylcyclotransferase family protein [Pseudomonadota bacterium]